MILDLLECSGSGDVAGQYGQIVGIKTGFHIILYQDDVSWCEYEPFCLPVFN